MQVAVIILGVVATLGLAVGGSVYGHNRVGAIWFLFFPSAVVLLIAGCIQWDLLVRPSLAPETPTSGLLLPANDPTPPNACDSGPIPVPKNAMLLLLGNSASWGTFFPQTIIMIGDDKMLTMNKISGSIALSGKFFSSDMRIVAELKDNRFYVNPNNYFRIEHPDSHSLVVFDQQDVEVLNARFINYRTMKITGLIRHPKATVLISDTQGLFRNTICAGQATLAHYSFH